MDDRITTSQRTPNPHPIPQINLNHPTRPDVNRHDLMAGDQELAANFSPQLARRATDPDAHKPERNPAPAPGRAKREAAGAGRWDAAAGGLPQVANALDWHRQLAPAAGAGRCGAGRGLGRGRLAG
ncbi:hypothetical protein GCM10009534_55020 [Kribbella sandramycini]